MVTIHSIEEMLNYYISLGGLRKDAANGFRYVFPRQHSKVRFWGDLHGFSAADADFTYPKDTIIRSQFSQRYVGIGLSEQGTVEAYTQRDQTIHFGEGVNCFVFDSPVPFFMKVPGGQRLRFQGLYFQEQFFAENNILSTIASGGMQRTRYTAQTFMHRSWCPSTAALSNAA